MRIGSYENQVTYASGELINGTTFRSGPVTVCVDGGTSYTLCNQGLDDNVASQLCQSTGYYGPAHAIPVFGSESDFGPSMISRAIYNISCPGQYFDSYSCSYGFDNSGSGCGSYGGRAIITCLQEGIQNQLTIYSTLTMTIATLVVSMYGS